MDNFRNPVGPLPSSIYWRRRLVVLGVLLIVAALVLWAVLSGGGGGGKHAASGPPPEKPTASITPGPSRSGPAIDNPPGGTGGSDGSGNGGDGSSNDGATPGPSDSAGVPAGSSGWARNGNTGSPTGSSSDTGSGATADGGTTTAAALHACGSNQVTLSLQADRTRPFTSADPARFRLKAANSGSAACKIDATPKVTITAKASGERVWSSADCPDERNPLLVRVAGDGTGNATFQWAKVHGRTGVCDTAKLQKAGPGDYRITVELAGLGKASTTFTLA